MPSAEIIAIGTELLLGEIQDTNTRDLALFLRRQGIDLFRTTIIGDNRQRIVQVIREVLLRSNLLITCGGLGPTVDDPTREAVAEALDLSLDYDPALWEQIQNRFVRFGRAATENNRRQAFIPQGALAVENEVGTAPAFIVECGEKTVICLPGVPREMQHLLEQKIRPYMNQRYKNTSVIKSRNLYAAGLGESQVDDLIGDLETNLNPTVGLLAHPGKVDIRITVKAESQSEADQLIDNMSYKVIERLGDNIFGSDDQTLIEVVGDLIKKKTWQINIYETGFGEEINSLLYNSPFKVMHGVPCRQLNRNSLSEDFNKNADLIINSQVNLELSLVAGDKTQTLHISLTTPHEAIRHTRTYGGPPGSRFQWAINVSLDFLRRVLMSEV